MSQLTLCFNSSFVSNKEKIRGFFVEYMRNKGVFKNKKALTEEFMPDEILHRDREIQKLVQILAPALRGYKPSNVFIYGGVGTGKTVCVKLVLRELAALAEREGLNIKPIYINCKLKRVADTEYRLLAQLLRELGIEVPSTGLPTDLLYRRFFREVEEKALILIIALDEIDFLLHKIGDDFLYNFTRINAELQKGKISFIGITNNLNLYNQLDARVRSSLGEEEIVFRPYNAMQLRDILKQRAALAFNDGVVSEAVINKCAAIAAQEHGDARRALDLLRLAGEIAERRNASKILEEHVDEAARKLEINRISEAVRCLPKQAQAVLLAIMKSLAKKQKVRTAEVYKVYRDVATRNNLRVLTMRRVGDLINELALIGIIEACTISRGRYGRTREIALALDEHAKEQIKRVLFGYFV